MGDILEPKNQNIIINQKHTDDEEQIFDEIVINDIDIEQFAYDVFVYDYIKYVVLKNEQFDEFLTNSPIADKRKNEKFMLIGAIVPNEKFDEVIPVSKERYEAAQEYYIKLKNAFTKEAKILDE